MRQGEINKGFDLLRERIPHPVLSKGRCEKLRKIDILHVAISYIRALENILESGEAGINEFANSLYSVVSSPSSCSLVVAAAENSSSNQSIGSSSSRQTEVNGLKAQGEQAPPCHLKKRSILLQPATGAKSRDKTTLKSVQLLKW
jgi:hypothetical protein